MPEKVLFKTGRIHGFSNRNAADDAEAVWRSHKKKSAKNYSLDRQTTSSQIGEITGVKRNCFLKNLRIVCRFFERRFSVPASESHRSVVLLAPIGEVVAESYPIRTVIQLSGRLFVLLLINWKIFCDLNEVNFVNFPQTTKRAGTQHIKSAGENLSPYL